MKYRSYSVAALLFGGAVLLCPYSSQAGLRTNNNVVVTPQNRIAAGALTATRNSADTIGYIYCEISFPTSGPQIMICAARDAANRSGSCLSTDPAYINAAMGVNSSSLIVFTWNTVGTCTSLQIINSSDAL